MTLNYTFSMIKPDAIERKLAGRILDDIESNGFIIKKMRKIHITLNQAQEFYSSLSQFGFYNELCEYMTSGPIIAFTIEKENAVLDFRELIGATNPIEAKYGTIRKKYGISKGSNSIHGSDSDESAIRESSFFEL